MKIACLNLGYSVMANIVAGSEAPFVEKCQIDNDGWSDIHRNFSKCTFNAVKFLSDYDIFAVQEVNNKYKNVFINKIRLFNPDFHFLSSIYHDDTSIMIGYDYNKFGNGIKLTNNTKLCSKNNDERAIQIIWFSKLSLLFINLHAPHNINLKTEIELVCSTVRLNIKPEKIIMAGDFNDESGQLLKNSINIFGMELRLPENSYVPNTCCSDVGYNYPGDYILVTDYNDDEIYFGLPPDYKREKNLYSDHDPVILIYY